LVRLVQPSLPLPFRHELLLQILPDKEGNESRGKP